MNGNGNLIILDIKMNKNIFEGVEWNESHRNFIGLPRPFSKVIKMHRKMSKLAAKVPIPWQSAAINNRNGFLRVIQENEDIVYYKDLCSYCGISINDKDIVVKWNNPFIDKIKSDGNFVFSDIHPLHLECMEQTRIYCPGMKKRKEKEFEYGHYSNLKIKSQEERRNIMNENILNLTNVFYFTADWCQPCKNIKPIVKEINRDRPGLKFQMIDADIEKELVDKFEIKSLPTFIIINKNQEIQRLTGSQTKEKLQEFLTFAEMGNHEKTTQENI
jgi:thiol-disulfide isomerase/thioredoxin